MDKNTIILFNLSATKPIEEEVDNDISVSVVGGDNDQQQQEANKVRIFFPLNFF